MNKSVNLDAMPSWLAFPMHGQQKLLAEGYRTRDGHFIEWLGKLNENDGPVTVISRPEPHVLRPLIRADTTHSQAANTLAFDTHSWAMPKLTDRRKWWVQSASSYRLPKKSLSDAIPAVIWNPFIGVSSITDQVFNGRTTVIDLLDDWTIHFAFQSLKAEVEDAYASCFAKATHVTANAEGTLALAHRFGRHDATLVTNGCDPDRFSTRSAAVGPITVGYVGKIGRRVDLELIVATAAALPDVNFVMAGPILDREYKEPLERADNIRLLGDVHYADVPRLLETFDVGWVPHRVGAGEVGGDVIKTYEYRAAHLPVLTTPIAGAGGRNLNGVYVRAASEHADWLRHISRGDRVQREPGSIPTESTWEAKARHLNQLGGKNAN
jgi:glycosyltransferase involved in cell wall biosynthesis